MEDMAQPVCKFHQTGHCKYGSTCRLFHSKDTCTNTDCDSTSCTARHPRQCKYFFIKGHCSFGDECSYLHCSSTKEGVIVNDIKQIQEELQLVKNVLQNKEIEIKNLKDKVERLEIEVKSRQTIQETNFECDICNYTCTSKKTLKSHTTKKHKKDLLRQEEALDSPSTKEAISKCKYWTCKYECETKTELIQHISMEHSIDKSFIYPTSIEEAECPECSQIFFIDHQFAMHLYTEHLFMFNCDHCHKNIPGDDGYIEIHMKMCEAPCDGDPHCPCRFWT